MSKKTQKRWRSKLKAKARAKERASAPKPVVKVRSPDEPGKWVALKLQAWPSGLGDYFLVDEASGETYRHRELIKKLGGTWDYGEKLWFVSLRVAKSLGAKLMDKEAKEVDVLVLTRTLFDGERKIFIGDDIIVELLEIRPGKCRIGITAPHDVVILREEVLRAIEREGRNGHAD